MSRTTLTLVVTLTGLVGTAAQAQTTYTLTPAQNIQATINAADDNDVIELMPGEYQQILALETGLASGKTLTIRSSDPDDPAVVAATILNGVGLDSVVRIVGTATSGTTLRGLTITGGNASLGGGVYAETAGSLTIDACVIEANAAGTGGGMYALETDLVITDTTFRLNLGTAGGGDGGGMFVNDSDNVLRRCRFESNQTIDAGGGLRQDRGTLQLVQCTFDGNEAGVNGGGFFTRAGADTVMDACVFTNNHANEGGAMYAWYTSSIDSGTTLFARNCVFQGNTAAAEGGAIQTTARVELLNCTLEGNAPDAAIRTNSAQDVLIIRNGILWNNGTTPVTAGSTVTYSIVQSGYAGAGNLDVAPLFIDAANGDLSLATGSPAIDAGDTTAYCGPMVDAAGAPRGVAVLADGPGISIVGPIVDMGAYEVQVDGAPSTCPADVNGNGDVDFGDLLEVLSAWGPCP